MEKTFHYLIMSQRDLFENEVIEELLRERANFYISKNLATDFWVLPTPNFIKNLNLIEKIQNSNFYSQKKTQIIGAVGNNKDNYSFNNLEFYGAIITTNKKFLDWLQLRLGYFEIVGEKQLPQSSKSNGIRGSFNANDIIKLNDSPLNYQKNYLHPKIYIRQYKKSLELLYQNKL